jgi:hypothetical protein
MAMENQLPAGFSSLGLVKKCSIIIYGKIGNEGKAALHLHQWCEVPANLFYTHRLLWFFVISGRMHCTYWGSCIM